MISCHIFNFESYPYYTGIISSQFKIYTIIKPLSIKLFLFAFIFAAGEQQIGWQCCKYAWFTKIVINEQTIMSCDTFRLDYVFPYIFPTKYGHQQDNQLNLRVTQSLVPRCNFLRNYYTVFVVEFIILFSYYIANEFFPVQSANIFGTF